MFPIEMGDGNHDKAADGKQPTNEATRTRGDGNHDKAADGKQPTNEATRTRGDGNHDKAADGKQPTNEATRTRGDGNHDKAADGKQPTNEATRTRGDGNHDKAADGKMARLSEVSQEANSMTGSGRSVAAIDRAVDVLFLFAASSGSLGVTEISNELGTSKAVVHRILTSLRERHLITIDPDSRRYSLGPAVLELAAAYRDQLDLRSLAIDEMRKLSAQTGETATISVRHGDRRVYVAQITPPREVKMTVPIGGSFPLHAGASSKAFLAWLNEAEIELYLDENPLEALTDATIVSSEVLRAELDRIRRHGFAVSLGERQHDAGSVAAPVLDHNLQPVAVISVCGPIERFRDKVTQSSAAVLEVTRALSTKLGAPTAT